VMATAWFCLLAFMLTMYVVLDGFDLGAGALYAWVARTPDERATVRHAIGPMWDANEVWLLAAGGTLYFAFPALYAASFSGFYLPLMVVLWLLIGRALGLELRHHVDDVLGRACDGVFLVSSALLPVFFGAALGNVVRGVPIEPDGYFFVPLWTNFQPGERPGVLDWYTVLSGVVALAALATHGARYLIVRAAGPVAARATVAATWGTRLLALLTPISLIATLHVRPTVLDNFRSWPIGILLPIAVAASLVTQEIASRRGRERLGFLASSAYLASMLGGAAFALYPTLLPSSGAPDRALTISSAATGAYAMRAAAGWWFIALVIVAVTFVHLYRTFRGKAGAHADY